MRDGQRELRCNAPLHPAHSTASTEMGAGTSTVSAAIHVVEDDHAMRAAIVRLLQVAGYAAREYASAAQFLIARRADEPGCILLDIGLPGMNGIELHAVLRSMGDSTPVVFLTGRGDIETGVEAMKAGAVDFLTKPVRREPLMRALDAALSRDAQARARKTQLEAANRSFDNLTPREREVFSLVVEGKLNKQIADELGTSVRTVKAHRAQVMAKMHAGSIADLVKMAGQLSSGQAP